MQKLLTRIMNSIISLTVPPEQSCNVAQTQFQIGRYNYCERGFQPASA